eukprot:Skav215152  [mRNA]  locus=scaffold2462:218792:225751:- [translate_table: standard]
MDLWRPWARSHGSGFVWDADGHIVTNSHVVQLSSLLAVHFASGGACRAMVVATSERCDVALLKLKMSSCSGAPGSAFELPKPLPLSKFAPKLGEETAVIGITTWQFQSVPLLTAAVSTSTLQQILPQLRDDHGAKASTIGLEEHLGPAKLLLPRPSNADLGVSSGGVRLWPGAFRARGVWWLDEIVKVGAQTLKSSRSSPVYSVADVLEAVQQAPVGSQLQLELRRFGRWNRTATAQAQRLGL